MASMIHYILKDLLIKKGHSLLEDPHTLKELLDDVYFNQREKELLFRAVQIGAPNTLMKLSPEDDINKSIQELILNLEKEQTVLPEFARWAIESWAISLDRLEESQIGINIFAEADARFRQTVRNSLVQGQVSDKEKQKLAQLQREILLSKEDARQILAEVLNELKQLAPQAKAHSPTQERFENSFNMRFVSIEPGQFTMGSPLYEKNRENNESQIKVTLTKPFYAQISPITQSQWKAVMKYNPSDFTGNDRPVENVSWNDIVTSFLPKLNACGEGKYRLPTEAEWEYIARAGTNQAYGTQSDANQLEKTAWYQNNSNFQTQAVEKKEPNLWGLHDIFGNILEWCHDW